jgi:hypothetical protein
LLRLVVAVHEGHVYNTYDERRYSDDKREKKALQQCSLLVQLHAARALFKRGRMIN